MKKCFYIIILLIISIFPSVNRDVNCETKQYKILLIASEHGDPYQTVIDSMTSELSKFGYIKDKNLTIKYYSLDNYKGRAKSILKQEKDVNYDLIAVIGTVGTIALKEIILDDPNYKKIVFSAVTDPVGVGVIDDFKNPPKHNFTGVAFPVPVKERFSFIKKVMPDVRKIGFIYADMPQSHSYNKWVKDFLKNDLEFKDYEIFFRKVPFVKGKEGIIRMAEESTKYIKELDPKVDIFLSANDQLGLQPLFPKYVYKLSTKPLIGIGKPDVMEHRGATMAIFPTSEGIGRQTANLIKRLLEGASVKEVIPEEVSEFGIAFDMKKVKQFGIKIPEEILMQAGNNIAQ
jgi:putative ABC transport system substrate-binding protein